MYFSGEYRKLKIYTILDRGYMQTPYFTGIFYMLSAMFVFSLMNIFVRDLTQHYPTFEVVFFRAIFIPLIIFFPLMKSHPQQLRTPDRFILSLGCIGTMALYGLFTAFQKLPLADATAFAYTSILFVTVLSPLVLGEKVGKHRWLAILAGFAAVLVMANPTGQLHTGIFYALGFSFGDALCMLIIRKCKDKYDAMVMVFYYTLVVSVLSGGLAMWHWVWPTPNDFGKMMILGIGSGFAQILLTRSFAYAPAVVVAPMVYSSLLWGVLFGYVFYQEIPTVYMLGGSAALICVGLYLISLDKKQPVEFVDKSTVSS